jgi:hypothetical protein
MSSSDGPRFSCPACGKSYRWKPEFAGRGAKCACGAKLVVPTEAPAAAAAAATSAAADEPAAQRVGEMKCPSCSASLASDAILCVDCGYNLKTGQKLAAVVVETDTEEQDEEETEDDAAAGEERA